MPIYRYKAKNEKDTLVEGVISALSVKEAESMLLDQKFDVFSLTEEKQKKGFFSSNKLPISEKIALCRYLSLTISSGLSVSEGLELISAGSPNQALKRIAQDVSSKARQGKPLYESFTPYTETFGDAFISMVKTGETAGTLSESFTYLAKQYSQEKELKQKVFNALMYPIIIIMLMFAVGILVFTFVLPQLAGVFSRMNIDLPFFTKLLFSISLGLKDHIIIVLLAMFGSVIVFILLIRSRFGKRFLSWLAIHTPLVKRVILQYNLVRFTQNLSALLNSSVPVTEAVELSVHSLSFVKKQELAESFSKKLTKGIALSKVLEEAKLFPSLMIQLVTIGERTGSLEKTLTDLSEFYEDEVEHSIKNFVTILEPVLMVIVGIAVGIMVISVISPIYGLISQLQAEI